MLRRRRAPNSLSYKSHRSDLNRRPLDYESRALPLSYGGAVPNLAGCGSPRYSTAMGRHSAARRKGATIYPPFRGGGSEPRPTTSRTARSNSADENGFLRLVAAPNSSASLRRSSRPVESPPDTAITFTPGASFRIRRTVTIPSCPGMKMSVIRASRTVLRTASSSSIRMIRAIRRGPSGSAALSMPEVMLAGPRGGVTDLPPLAPRKPQVLAAQDFILEWAQATRPPSGRGPVGKDRRKPRARARPHGHAKEALRASEERYGSVVAALAEGIVFLDADGRLQASNASAERILGLTAEQIGGRATFDARWRAGRGEGAPLPRWTPPI